MHECKNAECKNAEWLNAEGRVLIPVECTVRPGVLEAVVDHALGARPSECCGILLGRDREIVEAVPTRNLAESANRFLIDPKDHINARRAARDRGLDVIGFYHSHPSSTPEPSVTDLAEASYPNHLYLIVGLGSSPPEARLYRLASGRFLELSLVSSSCRW
jgi:proteasome lid subunit RPN8/RPN11